MSIETKKWQQVLSRLMPVRIKEIGTINNKKLKLLLHKQQFQLQYGRVIYSDGDNYFPFRLAFNVLKEKMPKYQRVLVLGAGIGSVGMILQKDYDYRKWLVDFVDPHALILGACSDVMQYFPSITGRFFQTDAQQFLKQCSEKYDLICIDVFEEDSIPDACLSPQFIRQVTSLKRNQDSAIVWNTMFPDLARQAAFECDLEALEEEVSKIPSEENSIYIF